MPNTLVAALLLSTLCLFTPPLVAQESHAKFATLTFENDIFVGDDGGYTNGFGLTFGEGAFDSFDSHNTPTWILWLTQDSYINTMDYKRRGISYTLFQRMQTPQNIETRTLIEDDVPYAGILAWHSSMYAWDDQVTDQLKLFAGVIGPISYAEETQSLVHSVTGSEQPQGWDNQLRNELVFRIAAHRVWSLYRSQGDGLQFEVVGVGGISAGTLESSAKVGGAIRWGNNLAASFPTFSLDADREINPLALTPSNDFYVFLGVRQDLVINDIMVDGNTFTQSHSVPLDHTQNQLSAGIAWGYQNYGAVLQLSSKSPATPLLDKRENYGALSLTYHY